MKKTCLLLAIVSLLGTVAVSAQNRNSNRDRKQRNGVFTLGPRLGLNYSTLVTSNPTVTNDYVLGYQAGAFVRANLGRKTYLQPEVYFNSKGSSLTFRDAQGTGGVQGSVRFSSVDVPVLLGYYVVNTAPFKLRLLAGPMVSFNMKSTPQGATEFNPAAYDFKERIWGGQIGVGVDVGNITVDGRYETGFEKINPTLGQRPSVFNLSVGFKIF